LRKDRQKTTELPDDSNQRVICRSSKKRMDKEKNGLKKKIGTHSFPNRLGAARAKTFLAGGEDQKLVKKEKLTGKTASLRGIATSPRKETVIKPPSFARD